MTVLYREKLWPAPWLFISTALVIPASLLVFLPINWWVGVVTAVLLYAGCVIGLLLGSPVVEVTSSELTRSAPFSTPITLSSCIVSRLQRSRFASRMTRDGGESREYTGRAAGCTGRTTTGFSHWFAYGNLIMQTVPADFVLRPAI